MPGDLSHQSVEDTRRRVLAAAERGETEDILASLKTCSDHIKDEILSRNSYGGSVLKTAVQHHQVEVVKLLVQIFQVNINATTLQESGRSDSALLHAIRQNDDKLVKELVKLGANVNLVIGSLTPLIAACWCQNLGMVSLLVDLKAEVNLQGNDGMSPLIALSSNLSDSAHKITMYLLDHGADCNLLTKRGETALHAAAVNGNKKVVQMLLERQARILPDNSGFTPLFRAAEGNFKDIFELFQCSDVVSIEDKVNALEFQASLLAPDDMKGVYQLLHQAMEMRNKNVSEILRKPVCAPVTTLPCVSESQTLAELEAKKDDHIALLMECLGVLDRLFGTEKMYMTRNFYSIWRHVFKAGRCDMATRLLEEGIRFISYEVAEDIFCDLLEPWSMDPQVISKPRLTIVEERLQCCIQILQRKPGNDESFQCYCLSLVRSCLKLLNLCIQLDETEGKIHASIHARNLIGCFPLQHNDCHSALHAATYLILNDADNFDFALYKVVAEFLVGCGDDVNKKDRVGRTPLLKVLLRTSSRANRIEIVEVLLGAGAHPAYLENDGSLPYDYVDNEEFWQRLQPFFPLALKHLAANAIVHSGILYKGKLSEELEAYVGGH